jgi:hypothetical protein
MAGKQRHREPSFSEALIVDRSEWVKTDSFAIDSDRLRRTCLTTVATPRREAAQQFLWPPFAAGSEHEAR